MSHSLDCKLSLEEIYQIKSFISHSEMMNITMAYAQHSSSYTSHHPQGQTVNKEVDVILSQIEETKTEHMPVPPS
eukprot:14272466-Ditylum_brightwellii.AAC.1